VIRESVGVIAIAVDCSCSVNARQLKLFEAEVRSILEGQRPQRIYVLYFDVEVHDVETYEAGQRVDLKPIGGGCTEFGVCSDWLDEKAIGPQTLVFLTDLYGSFPNSAPSYPRPVGINRRQHSSIWAGYPDASGLEESSNIIPN
jgi:predicted metal-dependent peptidase